MTQSQASLPLSSHPQHQEDRGNGAWQRKRGHLCLPSSRTPKGRRPAACPPEPGGPWQRRKRGHLRAPSPRTPKGPTPRVPSAHVAAEARTCHRHRTFQPKVGNKHMDLFFSLFTLQPQEDRGQGVFVSAGKRTPGMESPPSSRRQETSTWTSPPLFPPAPGGPLQGHLCFGDESP